MVSPYLCRALQSMSSVWSLPSSSHRHFLSHSDFCISPWGPAHYPLTSVDPHACQSDLLYHVAAFLKTVGSPRLAGWSLNSETWALTLCRGSTSKSCPPLPCLSLLTGRSVWSAAGAETTWRLSSHYKIVAIWCIYRSPATLISENWGPCSRTRLVCVYCVFLFILLTLSVYYVFSMECSPRSSLFHPHNSTVKCRSCSLYFTDEETEVNNLTVFT